MTLDQAKELAINYYLDQMEEDIRVLRRKFVASHIKISKNRHLINEVIYWDNLIKKVEEAGSIAGVKDIVGWELFKTFEPNPSYSTESCSSVK